jgi:hypothetical protein
MSSPLGISVRTQHTTIKQARIVPRTGYDVVEVVYAREPVPTPLPRRSTLDWILVSPIWRR